MEKKLPDYQFILWDTNKFDIESTIWTSQAFKSKKYAFASDYIRLYAIYEYGGIYLDTDVEVLKNFDDLLDLPYFIGTQYDNLIEAAVFGAEKNSDWVLECLKYYEDRSFIKEDGRLDLLPLPKIMQSQIEKSRRIIQLNFNEVDFISEWSQNKKAFFLYPFNYFSPKNHQTRKISKLKEAYTIHHYNNSWFSFLNMVRLKLIQLIGLGMTEEVIKFFKLIKFNTIFKPQNKS